MDGSKAQQTLVAFGIASFGIALFAGMDAVMKGLTLEIGVYNALFWRGLAGIGISGVAFWIQGPRWPEWTIMKVHLTRGCISGMLAFLFFWGLSRVPLAQGTALSFIAPIASLFLAAFVLGEKIHRKTIIASIVAFSGVLTIIAGPLHRGGNAETLMGSLAILAAALCYAWNIVLMRQQAQIASPQEATFFQSLIMTAVLGVGSPFLAVAPDQTQIPAILGAAALATGSLMLLSWAYARAEASYLSATEYTAFIWASIFGFIFFSETVSLYTLLGAAIIVAGCVLAAQRRPQPRGELEGII